MQAHAKHAILQLFLGLLCSVLAAAPQQSLQKRVNAVRQQQLSQSRAWQTFLQKHGDWSVLWNETTATPQRAFGQAVQLPGVARVTRQNIPKIVQHFLQENPALFSNLDISRFAVRHVTQTGDKWFVSYVQTYRGVKILFSELELRLFSDGKLSAFGATLYPNVQVATTPTISRRQAEQAATSRVSFDPATDQVQTAEKTVIFPQQNANTYSYHLAYRVNVFTQNPRAKTIFLVDAHSGNVLLRVDKARDFQSRTNATGYVTGTIQSLGPNDSEERVPFPDVYVLLDDSLLVTDGAGEFSNHLSVPAKVSASLSGPWVTVFDQAGTQTDPLLEQPVNPGDSIALSFDESNSSLAARDVFFHTNIAHDFITTLDPSFTNIDYSMPALVNEPSQRCNARWDGVGMIFYVEGTTANSGPCTNAAQNASIIYHEYTHGINDKLYEQLGASMGMLNPVTHEALADIGSAVILDDPAIGRDFLLLQNPIRTLENDLRYPDDFELTNSPHNNGLVLAGALWDLRLTTGLQVLQRLSHFAKYGLPDDFNTLTAFSEWFVEILFADDDDGDLGNGTPHFTEILTAFNRHGIGTNLFVRTSFSHTPLTDTQNTLGSYPVSFGLADLAGAAQPESVRVVYSTDDFATQVPLTAASTGAGRFQADIPSQANGTMVQYKVELRDATSQSHFSFPESTTGEPAFSFLVGFQPVLSESFEENNDWHVGAPDDDALLGRWEIGDPEGVTINNVRIQPNDDHSPEGTQCFVTGALLGFNTPNNVTGGKTTLFSPIYDLSQIDNPVVRFYLWYAQLDFNGENETFRVDISNDGGLSWVNVLMTDRTTPDWWKIQFFVADYVRPTRFMQLRFVASDYRKFSFVEALIDDFEILRNVEDTRQIELFPQQFALEQNYPNPFNLETRISFAIPERSNVQVKIFNLLGQEVRRFPTVARDRGNYLVVWDGRNNGGTIVSSGVYVYQLLARSSTQTFLKTRQLLLLK